MKERGPLDRWLVMRAFWPVVFAFFAFAASASAAPQTLTDCSDEGIAAAIAAGGEWRFGCDAEDASLPNGGVTVAGNLVLDAGGHDVGLYVNQRSRFRVTGSLELIGVDINSYVDTYADREPAVANGVDGTAAAAATGRAGTNGTSGTDGTDGQDIRGGCFHVTNGGHLTLRDLSVTSCGATATSASLRGGAGGKGGAGGMGVTGTEVQNGQGGVGGTGGHGGNGGAAGAGGDGGAAEGGAIYSLGRLDIYGVTFEGNQAIGGGAGLGGEGGRAGDGGEGGYGGRGVNSTGGTGGNGGQPGLPTPAGAGGNGGDALGGAIYAGGPTTISGARFVGNKAIGGRTEKGGYGGVGGTGPGGLGGSGADRDGDGRGDRGAPGAPVEGQPGAKGGNTGQGGDAHGGAVYFAGTATPATNTVSEGNVVTAGIGATATGTSGGANGTTYSGSCAKTPKEYQEALYPTYYTLVCPIARVLAPAGDPGSNGAASDADIASTALEAPFTVEKLGPPGEYRFKSTLDVPAAFQPLKGAWAFGDGLTDGDFETVYHTYEKPGPMRVKHSVTDFQGRKYETTKTVDVNAPQLSVSAVVEEDDLVGGRLSMAEAVPVRVRVSASCDGVGALKDLTFEDGIVLKGDPATRVELTGLEAPAEPFDVDRCSHLDFTGTIKGLDRGKVFLKSKVTGKDGADRAVTASESEPLQVGTDLKVTVTAVPQQVKLELDPGTQKPKPEPVNVTVEVENVSGAALKDVTLDLQARNRAKQATTTLGLHWVAMVSPTGGADVPLAAQDDPATLTLGSFAKGSKATRIFKAKAVDKSIVRVTGIARGTTTATPVREVTGNGFGTVLVDQPKLIAVDGGPAPPRRFLAPGEVWRYDPVITNVSPDEEVMVRVLTDQVGNVAGRPILDSTGPKDSLLGDIKTLDPGERWLVGSEFTAVHDGGTRGTVKLEINAWTSPYKTADTVEAERFEIANGALSHQVVINDSAPDPPTVPLEWAHAGELAWIFTKNFTDAGLRTLAGTAQMLWIPGHIKRGSVALYYGAQKIWSSLSKDELSKIVDELAGDVMALGRYDTYADAQAAVNQSIQAALTGPISAWDNGDAGYYVGASGTLLGSVAADALTAGIGKAALAKVIKGGTAEAALAREFEKQAATLAGRTAAGGSAGRAGLLAGDLLDFPLARALYGIDRALDGKLLDYARRNKLIIAMRDRSPGSIARLAEGLLPKIEKVKAKNVNSIDIKWLGFAESHRDIAMIKQMPDWDVVRQQIAHLSQEERYLIFERWTTRKKEFDGPIRRELEAYHRKGSIPVPGGKWGLNPTSNGIFDADNVWSAAEFKMPNSLDAGYGATVDGLKAYVPMVNSTGKKGKGFWALTGDMDAIAVLDANMQLLSMERRVQVYKDLARMGFQHPESLTWDNVIGRAKYLFDYDLANKAKQALLAYTPTGERRAVFFDSRKSTWELAGALGDRSKRGRAALADTAPRGIGDADDMGGGMFMLDGAPMSWDAPIVPITPYAGDIADEVDPDVPMYVTPAGEDGAELTNDPDAPIVRANPDGTYSSRSGSGARGALSRATVTWTPFTRAAGVLRLRVQTGVSEGIDSGASSLPVFGIEQLALGSSTQAWFQPGATIVVDPGGAAEEVRTVATAGARALTLTAPLSGAHRKGELVIALPPAAVPPVATATPAPIATATPRPTVVPPKATPTPIVPGAKLSAVKLKRKTFRARKGTTLSFKLTRAATVVATLRRKGTRKPTTKKLTGKAGTTKLTFGKGLKRGRYTATLTAGSNTVKLSFRVR